MTWLIFLAFSFPFFLFFFHVFFLSLFVCLFIYLFIYYVLSFILLFSINFFLYIWFFWLSMKKKSKFARCWALFLGAQYSAYPSNGRSWDAQLQIKDSACKIKSIRARLLHGMLSFCRRNVTCIKSDLNGSRNGTDCSMDSNLSVQVNRVCWLLKQLACNLHKRKIRI